jgi:uncharacterized membrane protein YccC
MHAGVWSVLLLDSQALRFIEVSIGIAVGLMLTLLWPEREP